MKRKKLFGQANNSRTKIGESRIGIASNNKKVDLNHLINTIRLLVLVRRRDHSTERKRSYSRCGSIDLALR